ncbi:N-acetylneuraminate synthase [Oscillospiraceae bacterium LTW-04]|nr:N-acetylneuraminate synthase [Oscillospiraceae bacterium MB24-C1]
MKKIKIIAEAGVNHNGSMDLAKQLVDIAAKAGADYIKFQTWKSESIISRYAPKAKYQAEATGNGGTMLGMVKKLELSFDNFRELKACCQKAGIGFLSTPFDIESAEFLFYLGVDAIKIPSGEITNLPLLEVIASFPNPILLSTGMCTLQEIEDAIAVLQKGWVESIALLHCNTQYPTPMNDINLRAMQTLKERFGFPVGLSDHSQGIEVPIAAAALGAEVIEKHFTLSHQLAGPDHKASADPNELADMIRGIRNIELAMGTGEKTVTESERENIAAARKSIVAARSILKGEVFTPDNITTKRPGTGISPMKWHAVIGMAAKRDFGVDELISL